MSYWNLGTAAVSVIGGAINNNNAKKAMAQNDPSKVSQSQAEANHYDQYSPTGSNTWSQVGTNADGTPKYANTTSLSAPAQQQFDNHNQQASTLGAAGNNLAAQINGQSLNPMDISGAGNINYGMTPQQQADYAGNMKYTAGDATLASTHLGQAQGYDSAQMDKPIDVSTSTAGYGTIQNDAGIAQDQLNSDLATTRDAYYKQQQAMLDPQWKQQQDDLANQLANSGVVQNSDAYNKAMSNFNLQRMTAYNNAQNNAIVQGGNEQSRLQNLALNTGTFHNNAQAQGFGQSLSNAQMQNQMAQFNQNNLLDTNKYNANAINQANQYNAGEANKMSSFNADQANGQSRYNSGADNTRQQFNVQQNNGVLNDLATTSRNNAIMNNNAQQQAVNQLYQLHNQPYSDFNAVQTNAPMPTFNNSAGSAPNMGSLYGQQYQNTVANSNNQMAGYMDLAKQVGNVNWSNLFGTSGTPSGTPSGGSASDYSGVKKQ